MFAVSQGGCQMSTSISGVFSSPGCISQGLRTICVLPDSYKSTKPQTAMHALRNLIPSTHPIKQRVKEVINRLEGKGTTHDLQIDCLVHPALTLVTEPNTTVEPVTNWISAHSFFENRNGFKESDLMHLQRRGVLEDPVEESERARQSPGLISHRLLNPHLRNPLSIQYRGFKTIRSGNSGFRFGINNESSKDSSDRIEGRKAKRDKSKNDDDSDDIDRIATAIEGVCEAYKDNSKQKKKISYFDQAARMLGPCVSLCLIYFIYTQLKSMGSLGSLKTRFSPFPAEQIQVKFADVLGCDEVKEQLQDVVAFLTDREDYDDMGAKLPRGVLLTGPPGVGKTLMAKAVAGEAGVPFFHTSGSEFDELYVGLGAKRVRELFENARQQGKSVIFVDEIDSVGRSRTSSSAHPYANQTINQLLNEMDGFSPSTGIIVIGATNKPEDLDKALTRPGRFDMQIHVLPPDKKGRKEILEHYLKKIKRSSNIDVSKIAQMTVGLTGADLQNLVNQAAMYAVKQGDKLVSDEHILYARDLINMGPERKSVVISKDQNKRTAYHEAGHALVAHHTKHAPAVGKVTIIPRGASMGHTQFTAGEEDEFGRTKGGLRGQMDASMGGFVGEQLIFGDDEVSTGASSDFQQATALAHNMVSKYGMSSLGFMSVRLDRVSPEMAAKVDAEVNTLLNESYARAKDILERYKSEHILLADALLEYETIDDYEMELLLKKKKLSAIAKYREDLEKKSAENKDPKDPNEPTRKSPTMQDEPYVPNVLSPELKKGD